MKSATLCSCICARPIARRRNDPHAVIAARSLAPGILQGLGCRARAHGLVTADAVRLRARARVRVVVVTRPSLIDRWSGFRVSANTTAGFLSCVFKNAPSRLPKQFRSIPARNAAVCSAKNVGGVRAGDGGHGLHGSNANREEPRSVGKALQGPGKVIQARSRE